MRPPRSPWGRSLSHLVVVGLLSTLGGCGIGEFFGITVKSSRRASTDAKSRSSAGLPKDDHFIQFKGKNREPKNGRLGFIQMPRELWQPFCWQTSAGLYDPNHPATRGIFCTEVGRTGSPPSQYFGMCAQVLGGGLNVYAYAHTSGSALGSMLFAGATEVDFKIEATVNTIIFSARPTGDVSWNQIATHAFSGQAQALFPSIGVSGIGKKQVVGFDNYRVVSNTIPLDPSGTELSVANILWAAADLMIESLHDLDGNNPDYATAATDLAAARAQLNSALTSSAAITNGKLRRKTIDRIKKARRRLADAALLVGRNKRARDAIGDLTSSLKQVLKAIFKLTPLPPPDPN